MTEQLTNTDVLEQLYKMHENREGFECNEIACENCALLCVDSYRCLIDVINDMHFEVKRLNNKGDSK